MTRLVPMSRFSCWVCPLVALSFALFLFFFFMALDIKSFWRNNWFCLVVCVWWSTCSLPPPQDPTPFCPFPLNQEIEIMKSLARSTPFDLLRMDCKWFDLVLTFHCRFLHFTFSFFKKEIDRMLSPINFYTICWKKVDCRC